MIRLLLPVQLVCLYLVFATKAACLVCAMVAAVLFAGAAPAQSPIPDPKQALREQEAADKLQRERVRLEIETNVNRLKYCVAGNRGCAAEDLPRLLLGLTRSEVEAMLGPPQYQLHLGANHLYYWTVPLKTNRTAGAVRVQLIFGDCYYREKNSRKKAVCEAAVH